MKNRIFFCCLLALALMPAGCSFAPKYVRPDPPVPGEWPTGAAYRDAPTAAHALAASALGWRSFFADSNLKQVIETALAGNRDLRIAALNVEMARALYGVQRDELYPPFYATGSGGKRRTSADLTGAGQSRTSEQYELNLAILSWELDFFGRIRNLTDQALEEYLATEQGRRSTHVLLISAVSEVYYALAADQEALDLAKRTLETQTSAHELVRKQYSLGLATELDLRRAQVPVDTARGDVARYTHRLAQDRNALELLAGGPVPTPLLPVSLDAVGAPRNLAAGLPSEVLLQRPDILAAEHRLKAAHAFIGAARAAFFPRISLTAATGTASDDLSGLFRSGTSTWSYTPNMALPIFDARTWSAYRVSRVQRELAVAQYERAIQNAFREAADALALCGTVDQQVTAQQDLVTALDETHRLAMARFENGIDSYLGVLDAQRSLFNSQQGLIALRLAQLKSKVKLYAALGGGQPVPAQTTSR